MDAERKRSRRLSAVVLVGSLVALCGAAWLIVMSFGGQRTQVAGAERLLAPTVTPEVATAPPTVTATAVPTVEPVFVNRLLLEFDLDTGSTEFSAVALNEDANRLLVADDENRLFEFDLAADGEPVVPSRRTLNVLVGAGDIEGIAWMGGNTYVLAHENDGELTVVEFGDETTTIDDEHLLRTIDTGIREVDGSGLEGVAYVGFDSGPVEFVVVDERPPTVVVIDRDGTVARTLAVEVGVPDLSDIWVSSDGTYSVLSDEGRVVLDLTVDNAGAATVTSTRQLVFAEGRFEQPEGIVGSRDGTQLYVVGEGPGPGRFVFGWWRVE